MKWFTEQITPTFEYRLRLKRKLFRRRSKYQLIEVAETYDFGRVLLLDGCIQLSTKDQSRYHDTLAQGSFCLMPEARRLLVIGGGDGGMLKAVLNHHSVESIKLVEIDEEVVKCSQKFFPSVASGFYDVRVELIVDDGSDYVHTADERFDIVIVDAPDPVGEGSKLFKLRFYRDCSRLLSLGGVLAVQSESPYLFPEISRRVLIKFKKLFRKVEQTAVIVPSYPGGSIGFTFGVKD